MTTKARALTPATLGSWLIKGSVDATPIETLIRTDFSGVTGWCVRRTYRLDLIRSGQPVLFWLSGDDPTNPAGIYAQGTTTGGAKPEVDDLGDPAAPDSRTLVMPVRLRSVAPPILRSELLHDPVLSQIEVITMAAGSNPSFLTRAQLARLRAPWPQVAGAERKSTTRE